MTFDKMLSQNCLTHLKDTNFNKRDDSGLIHI